LIIWAGLCLLAGAVAAPGAAAQVRTEPVTFSRDVAPILFEHCAACHRPGGMAPMSLISYQEVRPWARAIAEEVGTRRMPPWKPETGYGGPFVGERRLSDEQLALIRRWAADGAVEGGRFELPPLPASPSGWRLGDPDLVVEMPLYTLPPGGRDVLRKFAVGIPVTATRFVKGLEFQPGNARVVHHANMRIDPSGGSRRLDAADPEPGYVGVTPFAAQFPPGYFLGWTPGQLRPLAPDSMAWRLDAGADMLLELHLVPGAQPEQVRSRIGFFFADAAPTRAPATIRLGRQNLDIPAGATGFVSSDRYVLPVDVEVYGVQPHAHHLAREVRGFATLPDGTRQWLIYIKDWDFDWQDFYAFATPLALPRGTELTMEITYDNSAANARNPHAPPRRVTWGQQSSDEMGDLWIQVVPRHAADLRILNEDRWPRELAEDIVGFEMVLAADPNQVMQHDEVALLYLQFGKTAEAAAHFRESARLQPESAAAQYNLGTTLLQMGDHEAAVRHLEQALRLDPGYERAHTNLGAALRLRGETAEAIGHFRQALLIDPDAGDALYNLAWLLATHPDPKFREPGEAVRLAERACRLTRNQDAPALDALAAAYAAAGRFDEAAAAARAALALLPGGSEPATAIQNRLDLYLKGLPYRERR
jgi:tetratricopeptide (TPR) repeat protein